MSEPDDELEAAKRAFPGMADLIHEAEMGDRAAANPAESYAAIYAAAPLGGPYPSIPALDVTSAAKYAQDSYGGNEDDRKRRAAARAELEEAERLAAASPPQPWHEEAAEVAEWLESKSPNSLDEQAEGVAPILRAALAERTALLAEIERLRAEHLR